MRYIKRLFDIMISLILLVVFSWLLVLIALVIRLDSPGPALFVQTRIGKDGRPFRMWKFRTMYYGAEKKWQPPAPEEALGYKFQDEGDSRITKIGRFLRRSSLDELPQLFNVLLGQMSLVGPRPEIPEMVALYPPYAHDRHRMRPGITGLAQVMGRGDLTLEESLKWDLDYCTHWTIWLDLVILWKTITSVLRRQGAY
ncbi:sugar transferase [Sulfobacillus thermosulfidooxidans]|uniref:sugar transferase n=1 Tax=Sulfobacillus thermosulfidooxidans TaxID=28034 RepID=UPI0003FD8305|nr:sugar transferase [Sulfobacillus thermosulfidooxidans]